MILIKLIRLSAIIMCIGTLAKADPAQLINEAISFGNQIEGKSQKTRLDIYQKISTNINSILSDCPASNEARTILSKQSFGDFNPIKIQNEHIQELSNFYSDVCEVAPSYSCLGYISLSNGNDLCQNSETFEGLDNAFEQLSNALVVFNTQTSDNDMADIVISRARQCTAGYDLAEWHTDYYSSILVEMLLKVGRKDNATALIQDMNTPFFKFKGVLGLKRESGGAIDGKYISRLQKFIDEDVAGTSGPNASMLNVVDPKRNRNAQLAFLELYQLIIETDSTLFSYMDLLMGLPKYTPYIAMNVSQGQNICDMDYVKLFFNKLLDFQVGLFGLIDKPIAGGTKFIPAFMEEINRSVQGKINGESMSCPGINRDYSVGGKYPMGNSFGVNEFALIINLHGKILLAKGIKEATQFRKLVNAKYLSDEEMIIEMLNIVNYTEEELFSLSVGFWNQDKYAGPDFAIVPVFKKLVDYGNVCETSKILFQALAGTDKFQSAVKYMLGSGAIDPNQKHECGDEDLELLLK